MQYDPIKRTLGNVFNQRPWMRLLFYKALDILLLRAWYVRRELGKWQRRRNRQKLGGALCLDAGCGFGQYSYRIARLNPSNQVVAVDVKQEQIDDCNAFFGQIGLGGRVMFQTSDLTAFKTDGDLFDLAISIDVMEHIEDDEGVLRNICDALAPGATLIISTPSDKGGSDADEDHGSFIDEHVRDGYSIDDITGKLSRAGFTNINARYSYGTAGHLSWLLCMKLPILMLGKSKAFYVVLPIYYLLTYWICFALNFIDLFMRHHSGTGLIVTCAKR